MRIDIRVIGIFSGSGPSSSGSPKSKKPGEPPGNRVLAFV
jgi:hypothetical protein